MDDIDLMRDFNRYYTRRIGVLNDEYLGQGRPLGEARLLFEIGAGVDLRDLRRRLGLDSGYLSRMLRSLSAQGLVSVAPRPGDARVRTATLTSAGQRELADLEERSRASVAGLLEPLSADQRSRLVGAQAEIQRLLRLAAITLTPVPDSSAAARSCLRSYAAELAERFPEGYDAEGALLPPGTLHDGTFLLATEEDTPIACGLWQRLAPILASPSPVAPASSAPSPSPSSSAPSPSAPSPSAPSPSLPSRAAEIRHLWVSPSARGLGLARRLLAALEADAAAHGVTTVRLGTHSSLGEAIALYRSAGYREIPPYDESPYNQLAFEKSL
ncbi:GNAT family N-acetyltransferase [Paractinoplanes atraurantiacus]|uniref:DNA-binding transcriptional regulator, MarR family n=1 Tax=Paractinoplanes atraurantiacus TaxID=1036182 RepID=A0A285IWG7_9ACTN|nr:GNAT family N-acetyltransferase [Actinoplanes atraurantiacus]SNY51271.1 DNA-binding transcriptional regulator, MarR family [Actinoplanes atraurantiacus]